MIHQGANGASGSSLREDGSRGTASAVKTPGVRHVRRGRRALGWALLLGGVALVVWALSP